MEKIKGMLAEHITRVTQEEKQASFELYVGGSEKSKLIIRIMEYLDREIQKLHPESLDRNRLHLKVKIAVMQNLDRFVGMEEVQIRNMAKEIFQIELREELLRKRS